MATGNDAPAAPQLPTPGLEQRQLDVFIGKWINEGHTVARPGVPEAKIVTSDIYEWAAGGFHVVHIAYGIAGGMTGGGTEIIHDDATTGKYRTHFFDSVGNYSPHELSYEDGEWIWLGKWGSEWHRATSVFSDDGRIQTCLHERSDDGKTWEPSMDIVLTKVVSGSWGHER